MHPNCRVFELIMKDYEKIFEHTVIKFFEHDFQKPNVQLSIDRFNLCRPQSAFMPIWISKYADFWDIRIHS